MIGQISDGDFMVVFQYPIFVWYEAHRLCDIGPDGTGDAGRFFNDFERYMHTQTEPAVSDSDVKDAERLVRDGGVIGGGLVIVE
jgi:hypothetical protein